MRMLDVVLLALAGGLGAVLRHAVTGWQVARQARRGDAEADATWGIAAVNVVGSFLAGVCSTLAPGPVAAILAVGLLGGFTTFSTAATDSVRAGRRRGVLAGAAHAVGVLAVCVLAAWLGREVAAR